MKNITQEDIRSLKIPFPSRDKQTEIEGIVVQLYEQRENLQQHLDISSKLKRRLLQYFLSEMDVKERV